MFGLEFMWGAMLLTSIKTFFVLAYFIIVGYNLVVISKTAAASANGDFEGSIYQHHKKRIWLTLIVFVFGIFIYSQSTLQPKRVIELPTNRPQIEYNMPKEFEIITPPPRTERMDGFTPLKKD